MSVSTRLNRRKQQWLKIPGSNYEISDDGKKVRRVGTHDNLRYRENKPIVTLYFGTKRSGKKFPLHVLLNHARSGMILDAAKHKPKTPSGAQLKRNAWNVRPWQTEAGNWKMHILVMVDGPQVHQVRTGHEYEGITASSPLFLGIDAPLVCSGSAAVL